MMLSPVRGQPDSADLSDVTHIGCDIGFENDPQKSDPIEELNNSLELLYNVVK